MIPRETRNKYKNADDGSGPIYSSAKIVGEKDGERDGEEEKEERVMRNQAGVRDGGSPFSYYPRQIRTPRVFGPSGRFKPASPRRPDVYVPPRELPQRGRNVHQKRNRVRFSRPDSRLRGEDSQIMQGFP